MQPAEQAQDEGIGSGIAGPVEDAPADGGGAVEPRAEIAAQPLGEARAEPPRPGGLTLERGADGGFAHRLPAALPMVRLSLPRAVL